MQEYILENGVTGKIAINSIQVDLTADLLDIGAIIQATGIQIDAAAATKQ